jgi:hypothetical protein
MQFQLLQMDALSTLAAASGACAHLLVFRRGEWDVQSPRIFVGYASLALIAFYLERTAVLDSLGVAIRRPWALKAVGYHIIGIYLSMLCYRAFWHRLCSFPGPFLARLSNFYVTALSAKKLHLHEEVERLHHQYGDYVRLGEFTHLIHVEGYSKSGAGRTH